MARQTTSTMALTQVVDVTRRLVVNVASGLLNAQDMVENQLALRNDPAFAGSFRSLIDLRRVVDIDVSSEELRALALSSPFDSGVRRAYVVTSKEQFGVTRLYQAIIDADARIYRIFENYDEAVAWLDADLEK